MVALALLYDCAIKTYLRHRRMRSRDARILRRVQPSSFFLFILIVLHKNSIKACIIKVRSYISFKQWAILILRSIRNSAFKHLIVQSHSYTNPTLNCQLGVCHLNFWSPYVILKTRRNFSFGRFYHVLRSRAFIQVYCWWGSDIGTTTILKGSKFLNGSVKFDLWMFSEVFR